MKNRFNGRRLSVRLEGSRAFLGDGQSEILRGHNGSVKSRRKKKGI